MTATIEMLSGVAAARKEQIEEGDEMQFRFNLLLNGFVLASVAVRSATTQALAHAEILNGQGTKIGDADITSTDHGFKIAVKVTNLSPDEHGIHNHNIGKCEGLASTSAGRHFDPISVHHGSHNIGNPHPQLGDLRNLVAGNNGTGSVTFVANGLTLGDEANSPFHEGGTSLVIHAKPDDLMLDPSRNSGDCIACGVIES